MRELEVDLIQESRDRGAFRPEAERAFSLCGLARTIPAPFSRTRRLVSEILSRDPLHRETGERD